MNNHEDMESILKVKMPSIAVTASSCDRTSHGCTKSHRQTLSKTLLEHHSKETLIRAGFMTQKNRDER